MKYCLPLLIGLLGALSATAEPTGTESAAQAPNVVIFLADDQSWFDSGAYGNADIPTPNIDQLARAGMKFNHAFTSTALCAPARQQLLTGLSPVRSGAYPNHSVVREGTRSLVHYFRELGYRVGLVGKEHFGPEDSFPFERLRGPKRHNEPQRQEIDLSGIEAFMSRDPEQPFVLVVASNSPHTPWTQGDNSQFTASAIQVPKNLVDTPETRDALVAYYAEITHLDQQLGQVLAALEASGQEGKTIVIYNSEHGSSLPFAKWTLYDAGIRTALVVRWPGHVEPGATTNAMVQSVDIAPTLVEAAGGTIKGIDGRSFLPVLTGEASEHRDFIYGVHTNRGIIHGTDFPIRAARSKRYKLILNLAAENGFRNLISMPPRDALLASWRKSDPDRARAYLERPEVEFYDLEADPWELRNLAKNPAHARRIQAHRRALEAWMDSAGDRGVETEMQALDHMNPLIIQRIRNRFGEDSLPAKGSH